MAVAIIGDVHGCLKELKALIHVMGPSVDGYIFVGDLVDKGPDSAGVLRYVRSLGDHKTIIVQGNHEDKNFRFWKKAEAGDYEKAMEMKGAEELSSVMESTDQDLRDWIRGKTVPYVRLMDTGITVVHGGITPKLEALPVDVSELSGKQAKRAKRSMYIRYVDDSGSMVEFGKETPEHDYWADIYDGRFGHVYFGHQPFLDRDSPVEFEHATGLDLGCVHGGRLAAAVLLSDGGHSFLSIKAEKVYCDPILIN